MKHRLTALVLALALGVSLVACSGGQEPLAPDQEPNPDPTEAVDTVDPALTPIPDKGTPPPTTTHHPDDDHHTDPTPAATHHPDDNHTAASPTPAPSAAPTPEPQDDLTASDIYALWAASSSQSSANLTDMSSVMENFYDLSASDLVNYVLYMPAMSSSMEEVFIAKAKSGKVSTVKSACQSRLEDLKEDAELYPATAGNLDSAKIETSGDWVLLAVSSDASRLVKIFKDAVK